MKSPLQYIPLPGKNNEAVDVDKPAKRMTGHDLAILHPKEAAMAGRARMLDEYTDQCPGTNMLRRSGIEFDREVVGAQTAVPSLKHSFDFPPLPLAGVFAVHSGGQLLKFSNAKISSSLRYLSGQRSAGCPRTRRKGKHVEFREGVLRQKSLGRLMVICGFPGESADEIGTKERLRPAGCDS
jgi:hypothetical protein